jgi:hypothetical protein
VVQLNNILYIPRNCLVKTARGIATTVHSASVIIVAVEGGVTATRGCVDARVNGASQAIVTIVNELASHRGITRVCGTCVVMWDGSKTKEEGGGVLYCDIIAHNVVVNAIAVNVAVIALAQVCRVTGHGSVCAVVGIGRNLYLAGINSTIVTIVTILRNLWFIKKNGCLKREEREESLLIQLQKYSKIGHCPRKYRTNRSRHNKT